MLALTPLTALTMLRTDRTTPALIRTCSSVEVVAIRGVCVVPGAQPVGEAVVPTSTAAHAHRRTRVAYHRRSVTTEVDGAIGEEACRPGGERDVDEEDKKEGDKAG